MNKKEEEVIGEDPRCFRCGHKVKFEKASILLVRGGFVTMHPACHVKFIDEYRIQKGSVALEGPIN